MSERFGFPDHSPQHAPDHALQNPTPSYSPEPASIESWQTFSSGTWSSAGSGTHTATPGRKSIGVALILTMLFGPLGLLYATKLGALIVLIGVPMVFGVLTRAPVGGPATSFMWLISMIWAVVAVRAHNAKLEQ